MVLVSRGRAPASPDALTSTVEARRRVAPPFSRRDFILAGSALGAALEIRALASREASSHDGGAFRRAYVANTLMIFGYSKA